MTAPPAPRPDQGWCISVSVHHTVEKQGQNDEQFYENTFGKKLQQHVGCLRGKSKRCGIFGPNEKPRHTCNMQPPTLGRADMVTVR